MHPRGDSKILFFFLLEMQVNGTYIVYNGMETFVEQIKQKYAERSTISA